MKLREVYSKYILGFLFSLLVAISISSISRLPSNYIFSFLFGFISFIIYLLLVNGGSLKLKFKSGDRNFKSKFFVSTDLLMLVLYAISIIIVLVIPSNDKTQFVAWVDIPFFSYIRLVFGLLLASFLPGYGLLRIIDCKKRFKGLSVVLFSFFISVFATTFLSYALMILNFSIENYFWILILFNLIVLFVCLFASIKNREQSVITKETIPVNAFDYLILFLIFCFFIVGWIILYSFQLGSPYDMLTHYGGSVQISEGVKIFSAPHLAYFGDSAWFALNYVDVSILTGFPPLNGWMIYAFTHFFYILAVYQAVRAIVGINHAKIPIVATLIATLFAGFGWIKALLLSSENNWWFALNTAGAETYNDIIFSFIYGPIPQYFSLAVMFSLVYLMMQKDAFTPVKAFLVAILFALGLLVHSPELIMFPIFYYCYLFFIHRDELNRLKKFGFSLLLGLFIVLIVGLPFESHFYFSFKVPLVILFVLVTSSFVLIQIRKKICFYFSLSRQIRIMLIFLVWFLYVLSFFAWYNTLDLNLTSNLSAIGLKPWYIYPINSGISLLLGLLGLTYLLIKPEHKLCNFKFLILSVLSFFVVGMFISFINLTFFYTGYWEKRFFSFMILPLSVLGAFFVAEIVPKLTLNTSVKRTQIHIVKKIAVGLLISLILVSGVSSNILALDRLTLNSQTNEYASVSKAELNALDFLRANTTSDVTVMGLSTVSNRLAYIFSGMNHLPSPHWFERFSLFRFLDITNPELALKMLYSLNITYLYAPKTELEAELSKSSGYVMRHLLKYLPIAYQNSEVTIYTLPKLNPPRLCSNFTLVLPNYIFDALSDQSVLYQNIPPSMIFNETFTDYKNVRQGHPYWMVQNGTWVVENGVYVGNETSWKISSTLISDITLSDFIFSTNFNIQSGRYAGVVFRGVDSSNYYAMLISAEGEYNDFYKVVDGKLILIEHSTFQNIKGQWNNLTISAFGSDFSVKLNDQQILATSDSTFESGKIGLLVDHSKSSFDNVIIYQPSMNEISLDNFLLPIDMTAQSNLYYSIKTNIDSSIFNSKYLLLPSDTICTQNEISNYLRWVENGGSLIVLNGDGIGVFSDILSIHSKTGSFRAIGVKGVLGDVLLDELYISPLYSTDLQVKSDTHYLSQNGALSPFVFSKSIGKGEIIYLNIKPLFDAVTSDTSSSNIFLKIGQILNILNLDVSVFRDVPIDERCRYMLYDTTWIRNYIHLQGDIKTLSNCTILPYDNLSVGQLEIIDSTGVFDSSSIDNLNLRDVTLKDITLNGVITSTLRTNDMYIIPSNYGSYSLLFTKPSFNTSFQIIDGTFNTTVMANNVVHTISLNSGSINLNGVTTSQSDSYVDPMLSYPDTIHLDSKTLLLQTSPSVSVNGLTYFSEAYVPNYINYVSGSPVEINGESTFIFDSSTDNVILLKDFMYSGDFQKQQETNKISMLYWELTAIPWSQIITSPLFIIFIIIFCISIFSILNYNKYNKKGKNFVK